MELSAGLRRAAAGMASPGSSSEAREDADAAAIRAAAHRIVAEADENMARIFRAYARRARSMLALEIAAYHQLESCQEERERERRASIDAARLTPAPPAPAPVPAAPAASKRQPHRNSSKGAVRLIRGEATSVAAHAKKEAARARKEASQAAIVIEAVPIAKAANSKPAAARAKAQAQSQAVQSQAVLSQVAQSQAQNQPQSQAQGHAPSHTLVASHTGDPPGDEPNLPPRGGFAAFAAFGTGSRSTLVVAGSVDMIVQGDGRGGGRSPSPTLGPSQSAHGSSSPGPGLSGAGLSGFSGAGVVSGGGGSFSGGGGSGGGGGGPSPSTHGVSPSGPHVTVGTNQPLSLSGSAAMLTPDSANAGAGGGVAAAATAAGAGAGVGAGAGAATSGACNGTCNGACSGVGGGSSISGGACGSTSNLPVSLVAPGPRRATPGQAPGNASRAPGPSSRSVPALYDGRPSSEVGGYTVFGPGIGSAAGSFGPGSASAGFGPGTLSGSALAAPGAISPAGGPGFSVGKPVEVPSPASLLPTPPRSGYTAAATPPERAGHLPSSLEEERRYLLQRVAERRAKRTRGRTRAIGQPPPAAPSSISIPAPAGCDVGSRVHTGGTYHSSLAPPPPPHLNPQQPTVVSLKNRISFNAAHAGTAPAAAVRGGGGGGAGDLGGLDDDRAWPRSAGLPETLNSPIRAAASAGEAGAVTPSGGGGSTRWTALSSNVGSSRTGRRNRLLDDALSSSVGMLPPVRYAIGAEPTALGGGAGGSAPSSVLVRHHRVRPAQVR